MAMCACVSVWDWIVSVCTPVCVCSCKLTGALRKKVVQFSLFFSSVFVLSKKCVKADTHRSHQACRRNNNRMDFYSIAVCVCEWDWITNKANSVRCCFPSRIAYARIVIPIKMLLVYISNVNWQMSSMPSLEFYVRLVCKHNISIDFLAQTWFQCAIHAFWAENRSKVNFFSAQLSVLLVQMSVIVMLMCCLLFIPFDWKLIRCC